MNKPIMRVGKLIRLKPHMKHRRRKIPWWVFFSTVEFNENDVFLIIKSENPPAAAKSYRVWTVVTPSGELQKIHPKFRNVFKLVQEEFNEKA
jgi:hypothetical protein